MRQQKQGTCPEPAEKNQDSTPDTSSDVQARTRALLRNVALQNAMRKRASGVPTYTVPEAAALLSVSQEYLYRLIQADVFPAVRMRHGGNQGRYVVPAKAVEQLLDGAAGEGGCLEVADWTEGWRARTSGGAA
jgi:excisionase family DNA binding protein